MRRLLIFIDKCLKVFFKLSVIGSLSFCAFGEEEEKEKVLDLGEIEITGEVRRPNINLIYSKKYINKAMILIAREELKKLERELLKPARKMSLKAKSIKKRKMLISN